jgi:hypothetical protein
VFSRNDFFVVVVGEASPYVDDDSNEHVPFHDDQTRAFLSHDNHERWILVAHVHEKRILHEADDDREPLHDDCCEVHVDAVVLDVPHARFHCHEGLSFRRRQSNDDSFQRIV